ncbi:hypothetical protein [Fictibacillus phosphorivorans]|uniref:hypothetical protein n=1 Tax=Fictibacillus phosphorivorans TaxID=1221500 RepID=UPI00203B7F34|nr:hypothetical protein [Fictibacillus phosphorivorans]MCM3718104.1 hypothetical protein [Fictibacillus phosphorivorans]MCM3775731.1 hypothetical protein [Fictibacillus phosphorivorans]
MREPERIERILNLLNTIWQQQPDWRFNQLISNLQNLYSQQNNGYGRRKAIQKTDYGEINSSYLDFFFLEDDKWEEFLVKIIDNMESESE